MKKTRPVRKKNVEKTSRVESQYAAERWMNAAINLALKAKGLTSPNPLVGAVLVKNRRIIARGYHHRAGQAHAEVEALQHVSPKDLQGATLYVTLEPCAHFGRTGPCTNFLIKKGIKKVVVAMKDPNPKVSGKGITQLRKAGIEVEVGLLEEKAKAINEAYSYAIQQQRTFLILKMAITLDGKIATEKGDSKWITNELARTEVHRLRGEVDGILTSAKTVLADNPHLGVRMVKGRDPKRIIIDSKLETSPQALVYRDRNVLVATTKSAPEYRQRLFREAGIETLVYPNEKIPLSQLLNDLFSHGLNSVMIEAGSGIATAFLQEKLIQKAYFFIAPKIIGNGINVFGELGVKKIADAYELKQISFQKFQEDIAIIGYF